MPYVRPSFARQVFTAADGTAYEYGNRWPDGPPDETYSHDSHPERFGPLHDVADALVTHLVARYDVAALALSGGSTLRATRLAPSSPDAAPLTIAWLPYPAIGVRAGAAYEDVHPTCGCDACDETVQSAADRLERLVLGVAAGLFAESVAHHDVTWRLTEPDGWTSGTTPVSAAESARVRRLLDAAGGTWRPWPARRTVRTAEF